MKRNREPNPFWMIKFLFTDELFKITTWITIVGIIVAIAITYNALVDCDEVRGSQTTRWL